MSDEPSDNLEVKVSAAIMVVEHLIAICRGFESDEWLSKFLLVREALVSGRFKDAVREEARLTCYTIKTRWVGSRYMERRLEEVMGVLHRHITYPNHCELAAQIVELPKDVTVDCEVKLAAKQAEIEARRNELATVGYLKFTGGVFSGQLVALRAGETLIGRNHKCQVCIADPTVSRLQASIMEQDGRFFIAAISRNNPTHLNAVRINSEVMELKHGDDIQINDHTFQFLHQVPNPSKASLTPTWLRPQNMFNAWKLACKTARDESSLDWYLEAISQKGLAQFLAEELWAGGPPPSWKIDTGELGHLKAICANPDDTHAWSAYADWFDERGDIRGEFLRALTKLGTLSNRDDRYEPLRRQCIDLWTQVDVEWGTVLLKLRKSRILNCDAATDREPQVRFAFQCPNQWDSLLPGIEPNIRFCKDCQKEVYFCRTAAEAETHGVAGNCIAVSSRLAMRVEAISENAHWSLRPIGMTLGLPSVRMPYPVEQSQNNVAYQTWGEILFGDGE